MYLNVSLCVIGLLSSPVARSQTVEEIVVTARKVEENLQDVPVAVSAFTGDTLERRQITASSDLGKIVPNLQFTNNAPLTGNNNSSIIFIRGVGQISGRANTDPGVGLYIDDVYMGQSVGGTLEFRDIAGVQTLRGPQGTLFGRNTIGGAVLINTVQPGDEQGGDIKAGMGGDGLVRAFGAVDLPLSDTFKTRFTAGFKRQDGYVTRASDGTDLGDVNNSTVTGKFLYLPNQALTVRGGFDRTETDENGNPFVFAGSNTNPDINNVAPTANPGWIAANQSVAAGCPRAWVRLPGSPTMIETAAGAGLTLPNNGVLAGGPPRGYVDAALDDPRCANGFQGAGPYINNGTVPLESSLENTGLSLQVEYDFAGDWRFKSITSQRELEWIGVRDADNTPLTILHTDFDSSGRQFSQELQFNYQGDSLTGLFGVYLYREEVTDALRVFVGDKGAGTGCGPGTDRCHEDSGDNITENDAHAFFTQWSYRFNARLEGAVGVRVTEETKASTPDQFDYANPDVKYLEVRKYEKDFSATTLSASLSYHFSDSSMGYLSYAEGFKGGGWNSTFNFRTNASDLEAGHRFDQEEVKALEAGLKSDVSDSLRVNLAFFRYDYTDLQFTYRVLIAPWFFNAGEASVTGGELELTWLPGRNWTVEAGIGALDSSIDEPVDITIPGRPVNTGVAEGNSLPFSPEMQGNLGIGYTAGLGAGGLILTSRIDVSFSDRVYFDASNEPRISQLSGYSTVDLSFALEPEGGRWRLTAGVNNLTDEEYRISGNSSLGSGTGYGEVAYARKRVAFANLSYGF